MIKMLRNQNVIALLYVYAPNKTTKADRTRRIKHTYKYSSNSILFAQQLIKQLDRKTDIIN